MERGTVKVLRDEKAAVLAIGNANPLRCVSFLLCSTCLLLAAVF